MRFSYLLAFFAIVALIALGIPKRFGYHHDAAISFFVFLAFAIAVFLFEQKQVNGWPFRKARR